MDIILQWIGNPANAWIPIVTFLSISLIGGLVGYMNGVRTALYFLGWNLVSLAALVFSMPIAINMAQGILPAVEVDGFDTGSLIEIFLNEYGAVVMAVWLMVGLFAMNIIAFLVYIPFRGKLKAKIKENKMLGQPTKSMRWSGAGVGVLTAVPFTAAVTTVGTMTTTESIVTKLNSGVFRGVTMGQVQSFTSGQDVATIFAVVQLVGGDAGDGFMGVIDIITSGTVPTDPAELETVIDTIKDSKEVLEDMFENELIIDKILPEMVAGILEEAGGDAGAGSEIDAGTILDPADLASAFQPEIEGVQEDLRLEISEGAQDTLRKTLKDILTFKGADGVTDATDAEVELWIDSLFAGIINPGQ